MHCSKERFWYGKKTYQYCDIVCSYGSKLFSAFAVEDETKNALVYGDVNIDGDITVIDATDIQKYIVGLEELTADSKSVADVDSDGAISVMDATSIQKYIVGLNGCGKVGQQFVTE